MSTFGRDLPQGHTELPAPRHRDFVNQFQRMQYIFEELLHGNPQNFEMPFLLHYIKQHIHFSTAEAVH